MREPFEEAVEVFGQICDLSPEEQERHLASLADDPELRAIVEEILIGDRNPDGRVDRRAEDFVPLESVALEWSDEPVAPEVIDRLSERGRSVTHYRVGDEIGRGGMGAIFQVWDEDIERRLAMKVLGSGEAPHSSVGRRRLKRFLDEARVTGQLDHPGIVPVHDLGIDSRGRAYFTMKYVKGRTLQEVFELVAQEKEGWTQTRALNVLLRVCEAMSYAHAKGVVHRDLKPSNVMVGRFGEVYVMDWGVAWLRSAKDARDLRPRSPLEAIAPTGEIRIDSPVVTMDGTIVGTPYFMSPEQARGGWIDERSDVYAVGAMLYTLIAGRPPYREPGQEKTPYEVLERVIQSPPAPVQRLGHAPAELEAICQKAMARAAEDRYGSITLLADDLRAYLEGRVVRAYEEGAVAELRKWTVRNRALASALAAAFLILVAGLLATWVLKEEAVASEHTAKTERANALRLLNSYRLNYVVDEVDRLWPAHPETLADYDDWLGRARDLLAMGTTLAGADLRDTSWARDEREARRLLVENGARIAALSDPEQGLIDGISPEHGWGVARRRAWAAHVADLTVTGEDAANRWREAIASIADPGACPAYGGLVVEPQMGLLPIGRDPDSGLWEFAHLQSGEAPVRGDDGRLELDEGTGLVLVLIPGGTFAMGAQSADPSAANYDPQAVASEGPVHDVVLSPFFLSKYEMTQGQWLRLTGENPSAYDPDYENVPGTTLLHPVEKVSWYDCAELCRWLGMTLPTEAQWEYAARAGSDTPWWTGSEREWLKDTVNLADQSAKRGRAPWSDIDDWPELDDGFVAHAPVDAFEPNAFGLYNVHGNVWEWCRDRYDLDFYAKSPTRDPVDDPGKPGNRVSRGGSFRNTSGSARSSFRQNDDPGTAVSSVGLRPARALTGSR